VQHYPSEAADRRHRADVFELAQGIADVVLAFNRDLNVVLARGVRRMFAVALAQYRQVLDERSVLDFADVLDRALELLRRMDEFSQSRFRLEARRHRPRNGFQDTSRAQWGQASIQSGRGHGCLQPVHLRRQTASSRSSIPGRRGGRAGGRTPHQRSTAGSRGGRLQLSLAAHAVAFVNEHSPGSLTRSRGGRSPTRIATFPDTAT
jgi:hypothetical protein